MSIGMIRKYILSVLLVATATVCTATETGYMKTYTEHSPLVYEDAWDLWPYSFINKNGEPDGFNIELLHLIFKQLDIPYVIKLKPTKDALKDLRDGNSDLMLGMEADFHNEYGLYGQAVVKFFTHSVVHHKSQPLKAFTFEDLATHKVIVHTGSFSHHLMIDHGWGDNAIGYNDMQEALQVVNERKEGLVVWNTISLKWLLIEHNLKDLEIMPVGMPSGEYKFMANDPYLLARLDSVYGELFSTEQLQALQKKWFYPEYRETGIPTWVWKVAVALSIIAAGLLLSFLVYHHREKKVTQLLKKSNARLSLILQTSGVSLLTYDIAASQFTWLGSDGKPQKGLINLDFARRFPHEHLDRLLNALRQLKEGKKEKDTLELKFKGGENDPTIRDVIINLSVLRRNSKGKPAVLLGTLSDITEESRKQQKTRNTMARYLSVFNTSMINLMYFNEQGILTNLNERTCNALHVTKEEMLARKLTINDIFKDYTLTDGFDIFYATMRFDLPDWEHTGQTKKTYYETQLMPVYGDDQKLLGIYATGRDVTEMANNYKQAHENEKRIREANKIVTDYVNNINYALKAGGVRMAVYSPNTHLLTVYNQMNTVQHTLTQARCLALVEETSKKEAMRMINSMDTCSPKTISAEFMTLIPQQQTGRLYLHLHFVPITDKEGNVTSYLGMCRDVSEIKATERLLAQETEHAQQTENEKNEFMRNMSYEIRTPLNNVVGFAELFEKEHTPEEESIFISQIKENSSRLLDLINNILFISRLDARMIEITPHTVNFAEVFEGYCKEGWKRRTVHGVRYIVENTYHRIMLNIDDMNLAHVIRQVTANAAQNTATGTVRARYDYINDQLVITIEDTGCGIPEEKLHNIYDRFVSGKAGGTGLGLSICRELMEQMGGTIKIKSKVGKGTTVWISLPCQASEIERN